MHVFVLKRIILPVMFGFFLMFFDTVTNFGCTYRNDLIIKINETLLAIPRDIYFEGSLMPIAGYIPYEAGYGSLNVCQKIYYVPLKVSKAVWYKENSANFYLIVLNESSNERTEFRFKDVNVSLYGKYSIATKDRRENSIYLLEKWHRKAILIIIENSIFFIFFTWALIDRLKLSFEQLIRSLLDKFYIE